MNNATLFIKQQQQNKSRTKNKTLNVQRLKNITLLQLDHQIKAQ